MDHATVAERVRQRWTGNRWHDLAGFALGPEFDAADEAWHREAARRYELQEAAKRAVLQR